MENPLSINIKRLILPDKRSFHGSVISYKDAYICIYHNSENHRLGSCFVELDSEFNFKFIENTHVEDLGISKYIDPRIIKYDNQYFLSLSCLNILPIKMCLFSLDINDKITISKNLCTFSTIREFDNYNTSESQKNWTPWQHKDKFLYVYSLNPHRILEVDINNTNVATLIAETSWKSDTWWDKQQWVEPKYRLNCPPVLLPDGTYLSAFHTMKMSSLSTPWHRIKPNNLLSYWTGFYQFEGKSPFRVLKISDHPFMTPDFLLPADWKFHPPPSGGNPFYPFSMMLVGDQIIMAGGSNEIEVAYCSIPLTEIINTLTVVKKTTKPFNMNILLNDREREIYKDSIQELHVLCPETIARKIPRANVQQGFMLDAVKKLFTNKSELLCVGSYEDTACESLIKLGYNVTAIDPVLNVSLEDFFKSTETKFDLIFSTSVIEHVQNDELFIRYICGLLKPEGYAILTCDFNNDYGKPGVNAPGGDYRLYTKNDLIVRFGKILNENNCEMYGEANYDSAPDFHFANCVYSFATYVFQKK